MRILVTGGAGYIGSHTVLELLGQVHDVVVVDNFSNSSPVALDRVRSLTNGQLEIVEADLRDTHKLTNAFKTHEPEAVIHFAGLKVVGDSLRDPLTYYEHNLSSSLSLLRAMDAVDCNKVIFSSTASIYGEADYLPIDEKHPVQPMNPYGRTKYFFEEMMRDWVKTNENAGAVALRYFNPVGAHRSGIIGEDPSGTPSNLMPFVSQVAIGKINQVEVFGDDYDTRDGTGLRDYIHVSDLARAHVAAAGFVADLNGFEIFNLGTGSGATVLEVINTFGAVNNVHVPYKIAPRRLGDMAASYADPSKAEKLLGWKAQNDLEAMCKAAWKWQTLNENGYEG